MNVKPKIAMYWLAGCGGCEESILDLAGKLFSLQEKIDIVCWPIALDVKLRHIEAMMEKEIDVCLINGAVRTREHVEMAELLRAKSRKVLAHGACAHLGGVVGLANFFSTDQILSCGYRQQKILENPCGTLPGDIVSGEADIGLPPLLPKVLPLKDVIEIDGVIPGCPPTPEIMLSVFDAIAGDSVKWPSENNFGDSAALCRTCPLRKTIPESVTVSGFKRLHTTQWDPDRCFLAQGLICLGPVTRGGCGARCISAHMPCRGCFGPADSNADPGVGGISLAASMMETSDENAMEQTAGSLPDPAGLFYRYGLAAATLAGKIDEEL